MADLKQAVDFVLRQEDSRLAGATSTLSIGGMVLHWGGNSAITSILIGLDSPGNFVANSVFTLYGTN